MLVHLLTSAFKRYMMPRLSGSSRYTHVLCASASICMHILALLSAEHLSAKSFKAVQEAPGYMLSSRLGSLDHACVRLCLVTWPLVLWKYYGAFSLTAKNTSLA